MRKILLALLAGALLFPADGAATPDEIVLPIHPFIDGFNPGGHQVCLCHLVRGRHFNVVKRGRVSTVRLAFHADRVARLQLHGVHSRSC